VGMRAALPLPFLALALRRGVKVARKETEGGAQEPRPQLPLLCSLH
jgi:hypothetical protein